MSDKLTLQATVTAEYKQAYLVHLDGKELPAQITGKFLSQALSRLDFPTVGDLVEVVLYDNGEKALIHEVCPRKSILLRKAAGTGKDAQPLAANIDKVFIVMGLDANFNIARLERLLVAAWDSGATPAVILTKKDLCTEAELAEKLSAVARAAPGMDTACICGISGDGTEVVRQLIGPDTACCFLGSSGVGKSTLLNRLCGFEAAQTQAVREDDCRGRHTTVARHLYFLPTGARIIDTPGIREFCLEYAEDGLDASFPDIEELAAHCKFKDCSHRAEPDCAVKAALEAGTLSAERLKHYQKMQREMFRVEIKHDTKKQILAKRKLKTFAKLCRNITQNKRKLRGG